MPVRPLSLWPLVLVVTSGALAGDLNPPLGPVAETGRFGPRTEVNDANTPGDADSLFRIAQPGSYYLSGNIVGVSGKGGIEIASSGVTLDLNGFDVTGANDPTTHDGIFVSIIGSNFHLINGSIRSWGGDGVTIGSLRNKHITGIRASDNDGLGFSLGSGAILDRCIADLNQGGGISGSEFCNITHCLATDNNGSGIDVSTGSTVIGCAADDNFGNGIEGDPSVVVRECTSSLNGVAGIKVGDGSSVIDCAVSFNAQFGIETGHGCLVERCVATNTLGIGLGIVVNQGSTVRACVARDNNGAGITLPIRCLIVGNTSAGNSVGIDVQGPSMVAGNHCSGSSRGIFVAGSGAKIDANFVWNCATGFDIDGTTNLIVRNAASNCTIAYDIVGGNDDAEVITSPGSAFVATNPWANFEH